MVWLQKELQVSRIPDSPVLRFHFNCSTEEAATSMKIIDALLKVYKQEIELQKVHLNKDSDKQLEKLTTLHKELSDELRHKIEKYQNLAGKIGGTQSPIATAVLNMLINEIRMIKSQIIEKKQERVELDVTLAIAQQQSVNGTRKVDDHLHAVIIEHVHAVLIEHEIRSGSIEKHIASLEQEYEEKVKEIEQKGVKSGALTMLESEIKQLQQVEIDMEYKLRNWPIGDQPSVKAIILMPATVTSNPTLTK